MVGAHDVEVAGAQDGGGPGGGACDAAAEISVVTVNVDGFGDYEKPAATRLEAILDTVLAVAPDVLLLQEIVPEMYEVARRRLPEPDWLLFRKRRHTEDYFNVTAVRRAPTSSLGRMTSYPFSASSNGRHLLIARRGAWTVVNAHAESGGRAAELDHRAKQLAHMSRMHEHEDGQLWVLAGDFNVREGEDHCLRAEG